MTYHCCGTCIHIRVVENCGCELHECALDPNVVIGAYTLPCEDYKPDVDYIKFMGFEEMDE